MSHPIAVIPNISEVNLNRSSHCRKARVARSWIPEYESQRS